MFSASSLVVCLLACTSVYASWWEMARDAATRDLNGVHCNRLEHDYGLTKEQVVACELHSRLMRDVFAAAGMALKQCERQFKYSKWNCSTAVSGPLFGVALENGTREAAFVQSLFTAALSARVTRTCSDPRQYIPTCGCDRSNALKVYVPTTKNPRWSYSFDWDDCSDNIKFGNDFATTFTSSENKGQSARELMNKHNSQAGLEVVSNAANLSCFCHGFSGSCALRTCWIAAPSMNTIGNELKKAYNTAVKVKRVVTTNGHKELVAKLDNQQRPDATALTFTSNSQDFCTADKSTLSLGTVGRECNASLSSGEGSCKYLCCGRGYSRININENRECCRFHWCCEVRCQVCSRERPATVCN